MNFDDDQIKVIEAEPVPQLVIAGPGSGKTAVLTHRIRYLNEHFKIPLDKILVIKPLFKIRKFHFYFRMYHTLNC